MRGDLEGGPFDPLTRGGCGAQLQPRADGEASEAVSGSGWIPPLRLFRPVERWRRWYGEGPDGPLDEPAEGSGLLTRDERRSVSDATVYEYVAAEASDSIGALESSPEEEASVWPSYPASALLISEELLERGRGSAESETYPSRACFQGYCSDNSSSDSGDSAALSLGR